jgi:peroxiredoxin
VKYTKPLLVALAVLAAVGALLFALMEKPSAPASTFITLEGKTLSLEELRGKVVLVNFWATSCPGCIKEMPGMIETYRQYKDRGFEIVAVAMSYDPPNYVANFVQTRQLPFPVALDVNGAHARAFGNVQLTPTSFIIGKDGRILEQKLGELDFARLKALLDRELS